MVRKLSEILHVIYKPPPAKNSRSAFTDMGLLFKSKICITNLMDINA
jgi:hypothetical protein